MLLRPQLTFEVLGDPSNKQNKILLAALTETKSPKVYVADSFQAPNIDYKVVLFVSPGSYRRRRILRIGECSLYSIDKKFCPRQMEFAGGIPPVFLKVAVRQFSDEQLMEEITVTRLTDAVLQLKRWSRVKLQGHLHRQNLDENRRLRNQPKMATV